MSNRHRHDESNRDLLFSSMQSLSTRLTAIQTQVEQLVNYTTGQVQQQALDIEVIADKIEDLYEEIRKIYGRLDELKEIDLSRK